VAAIDEAAAELGVSRRQMYVLLQRFRAGSGRATDLMPAPSSMRSPTCQPTPTTCARPCSRPARVYAPPVPNRTTGNPTKAWTATPKTVSVVAVIGTV
jgi:hypothetical protein